MRIAEVTIKVWYCDNCPNIIKGLYEDFCNIADKPLPEIYGLRELPEWCPCLIK